MFTVREFVEQSYQLVSASSPTVPLHGSDLSLGIRVFNQLLQSYATNGLMITVAKQLMIPLAIGQQLITTGDASLIPTPDIPQGRLIVIESAWLVFNNVSYPLINLSRDEFDAAWKYVPLQSLPRFIIVEPDIQTNNIRIYPSPSQFYEFNIRAKFQLPTLSSSDDMSLVPTYTQRYFLLALARELAVYKGRAEAWTDKLEARYIETKDDMEAASEVNVSIVAERDSLLNGAYRVRAGI